MFPYRAKYTESEYDIQNIILLYKIDQECQNTVERLEHFENSKTKTIFYYLYNFHNSYGVDFLFFVKNINFVYFVNFISPDTRIHVGPFTPKVPFAIVVEYVSYRFRFNVGALFSASYSVIRRIHFLNLLVSLFLK